MVEKKRHWFLTCWLLFLMLIDVIRTWYCFIYLPVDMHVHNPNVPQWVAYSLGIVFLGNILCIYGLLKWSIWGFWGYCTLKIIEIFIKANFNFGSIGHLIMVQSILLLILIYMLNVGGENKAWKKLQY